MRAAMSSRVCIIGAGISGLRCAAVLLEHGVEVVIIEARNRIGGRIAQSSAMGPMEVDMGANWVHSTGDNPIVKLAKETETPLHEWHQNTLVVDTDGGLVSSARANGALNTVWQVLEKAIGYSKVATGAIDPSLSLYDFFTQTCTSMVQQGHLTSEDAKLVTSMSQMWGAYVGERVERQSLKFFFLEDCIGGSDCFIPSNYKKIVARVASRPLEAAEIHFNTVMASLAAIKTDIGSPAKVRLRTTNGVEQEFDAAVITTPLGWLKRHQNAIQPLSERIMQAIDALSFGNLEKILIEFPFAFWDSSPGNLDHKPISFVHWLSPKYASESNPQAWRLECVSFNAFPPPYRRNMLLFYTFGDCSLHITSLIHGKEGVARFELLRDFFEPYYSRLPHYNPKTCIPQRILATEWSQDEFSGFGSYCNFQVGVRDAAEDVKALRHGMPEHSMYFAGEHTAPFDGLGTVAGAFTSGDLVANRILEAFSARE